MQKLKTIFNSKFFKEHKEWLSQIFSGFVATVLGIAVTLGIDNYADYKENREIIQATVFNGLSDLDNYEEYLAKEDSAFSLLYWLPEVCDCFLQGDSIDVDSVYKSIKESIIHKERNDNGFYPTGRDFLIQSRIENVKDMETFRIINIAYEEIDESQAFINEKNSYLDDLNELWLEMFYSKEVYTKEDVIGKILSHPSAHKLCLMIEERFIVEGNEEANFFEKYIKNIDYHRQRILKFSDANLKAYEQFKINRLETDKTK